MSVRRMTSYRLFLVRSALARFGRALAYYGLSMRTAVRTWFASYRVTMVRHRIRSGASGTGGLLLGLPRKAGSLLGLVAWFFGQLPPYLARVLEERREDRAELRAERKLATAASRAERAERRARRRAQAAQIKADSEKRPHHLPVPAWISRMELPERSARAEGARRLPAPRLALVAAAITVAAAVPGYAIVSGAVSSGDNTRATPAVGGADAAVLPEALSSAAPAQAGASPAGAAAPGPVVSGETGEFVRTPPPLPTVAPTVAAPGVRAASVTPGGAAAVSPGPVVGSMTKPLSAHQQREVRRQAKWEAKQARVAKQLAKDEGK